MDEHAARRLGCFVEEAARGLRGLDASVWRDRIDGRYRELEAAFEWLLDHGQADDALAMASGLAEFLRITGRVATGRRWLDHALAAAPTDDHLKAVGLYEAGMLAFWQGADEDACSLHGRSLQLARRLGDPTTVALALCGLARVALREDLDWARTLCEEALQTVEATDDRLGRANALHVLGVAAQMRGDLGQARALMTRRIETARELTDAVRYALTPHPAPAPLEPSPVAGEEGADAAAVRAVRGAASGSVLVEVDEVAAGVVKDRVHAAVVHAAGLLDEHHTLGLEPLGVAGTVGGGEGDDRPALLAGGLPERPGRLVGQVQHQLDPVRVFR
jgi:hypothetical protein